jgi:glyoxylase-like metal-dependent hydrolase (beta-lactamase superfamily II)
MIKAIRHSLTISAMLLIAPFANAEQLQVTSYNPAEKAIFPVTSSLITGEKEAILVDAQFSIIDADALVTMINDSGKKLTTIYISGGDPDFYFGLQPIVEAFPEAKVIASSAVVKHIEQTKENKLAYWGPILGSNAPSKVIIPEISDSTELTLEGKKIKIHEINTHQAYLWLPSIKTALGGVLVSNGIHLWTADSQSVSARQEWLAALDRLIDLNPLKVIPGHYLGDIPAGDKAVKFTKNYLLTYESILTTKPNSTQLIERLKNTFPNLPVDDGLAISAKVNTGEIKW